MVFAGCAGPHEKMQQEAQARWEGMRAKVKVRLASEQFEQGRVAEALGQLNEAIRLDQESPGAAILLAKIQLAKGQLATARETLDEAERAWDATAEIPYLRGVLEERAGRSQEAFEAYREAFEAEPDNSDYFVAVCESMLALGMVRQTIAWLDVQEEAHGHTGAFHVLMGRALRLDGRPAEAAAAYEAAVETGAMDDEIREARALCLMWAERYAEAAELLRPLLARVARESRPSLQLALCRCLLESGDIGQAGERLALLSRSAPDSVPLRQLMARAAWARDDGPAALRHARRAAAIEGAGADVHLMVAVFAYRLGQDELAYDVVQKVLSAEPTNPLGVRLRRELNRRRSAGAQTPEREAAGASNVSRDPVAAAPIALPIGVNSEGANKVALTKR